MEKFKDTIVAIGTPFGRGAISLIRVSGKDSFKIVKRFFKKWKRGKISFEKIYFGYFYDGLGDELDEVGVIFYKSPHSYTGEDMVEIMCHGSPVIASEIVNTLIEGGARLAHRGEFTERRYLNGKIDLTQAEAINDLINSTTLLQAKVAESMLKGKIAEEIVPLKDDILSLLVELETEVEFSEDGIKTSGRDAILNGIKRVLNRLREISRNFKRDSLIKEGMVVCIVGKPNAGKSSLFNALIRDDRAIVSEHPGTTRDYITEVLNIYGIPVNLIDTAGIRDSGDVVESQGVKRSLKKIDEADLILLVMDVSQKLSQEDFDLLKGLRNKKLLLVLNKIDLPDRIDVISFLDRFKFDFVGVSAKFNIGMEGLKNKIYEKIVGEEIDIHRETIFVTSKRQQECILNAINFLEDALFDVMKEVPEEYISYHLRKATESLSEIFGEISTEDILNTIFSSFCIGK